MVLFISVVAGAWTRGLDITCGCFGGSDSAPIYSFWIVRNLLILAGVCAIPWLRRRTKPARESFGTESCRFQLLSAKDILRVMWDSISKTPEIPGPVRWEELGREVRRPPFCRVGPIFNRCLCVPESVPGRRHSGCRLELCSVVRLKRG